MKMKMILDDKQNKKKKNENFNFNELDSYPTKHFHHFISYESFGEIG